MFRLDCYDLNMDDSFEHLSKSLASARRADGLRGALLPYIDRIIPLVSIEREESQTAKTEAHNDLFRQLNAEIMV